jgi:hypothetical protein
MEELLSEISRELEFNSSNLQEVLQKTSKIYSFLLNKWYKLGAELDDCEIQLGNRRNERYSYYKLDFNIELNNSEINKFIDGDLELNDIRSKMSSIKRKIDVIEKLMSMVNDTRWSIKSYIEWEKFKSGLI